MRKTQGGCTESDGGLVRVLGEGWYNGKTQKRREEEVKE